MTALVLTGCTTLPEASTTPIAPVTRSAQSTPSASSAALPLDVLLRVSGTITAQDGTVVRLVETAYVPKAGDGSEAAMMSAQCDQSGTDWRQQFPDPQWVWIGLTSSYVSGSALPYDEAVLVSGASGSSEVAWTGAWHNGQAYCSPGYAQIPGDAEGVAPVVARAPLGDKLSWSGGAWGFSLDHERDSAPPISFTECRLELGSVATSAASLLQRQPAVPGFPQDCVFGTGL